MTNDTILHGTRVPYLHKLTRPNTLPCCAYAHRVTTPVHHHLYTNTRDYKQASQVHFLPLLSILLRPQQMILTRNLFVTFVHDPAGISWHSALATNILLNNLPDSGPRTHTAFFHLGKWCEVLLLKALS